MSHLIQWVSRMYCTVNEWSIIETGGGRRHEVGAISSTSTHNPTLHHKSPAELLVKPRLRTNFDRVHPDFAQSESKMEATEKKSQYFQPTIWVTKLHTRTNFDPCDCSRGHRTFILHCPNTRGKSQQKTYRPGVGSSRTNGRDHCNTWIKPQIHCSSQWQFYCNLSPTHCLAIQWIHQLPVHLDCEGLLITDVWPCRLWNVIYCTLWYCTWQTLTQLATTRG